mgnify:CR=1 FL=1
MGPESTVLLGPYLDKRRPAKDKHTAIIRSWNQKEMALAIGSISKAAKAFDITAPDKAWRSKGSQARGNLIANLVIETFENTKKFRLETADGRGFGSGYPDAIGHIDGIGGVLVELKATKSWNTKDSNRRVLLSSVQKSLKMLKTVNGLLPLHLILTAIHDESGKVITLRFDFLQRESEVTFREEISTSHKLLSKSPQNAFIVEA